jgi:UDP-glucose:(heptosyl)LPS alpha-1,3-glucosyltransferase
MQIALVGRRFDAAGGGTERDLLITARVLAEAGHEVTIYADEVRSPGDNFIVRQVARIPIGRALRLLSFGLRVSQVARRDGAQMIVSFARAINTDVLRSGGGAHASYVRAARQWQTATASAAMWLSPYHRVQIALERAGFKSKSLRGAIAVSEMVRRDLIETFALASSRVFTLYNGVNLQRFAPKPDESLARRIRRELGIPEDSRAVAFVGHGYARKGLGFLLEAWHLVDPRCYLIAAGADRTLNWYRRRASQLGVSDRVIFIGPCAHIEQLLAAVDGVALPSLFEPFGNVVMEAMAAGLPVLCSRKTGAAELIPRELSELIIEDPTDIEDLARGVNLLLSWRDDVSSLVRATAEQYTWERYGKELVKIIS